MWGTYTICTYKKGPTEAGLNTSPWLHHWCRHLARWFGGSLQSETVWYKTISIPFTRRIDWGTFTVYVFNVHFHFSKSPFELKAVLYCYFIKKQICYKIQKYLNSGKYIFGKQSFRHQRRIYTSILGIRCKRLV